MRKTIAGAMALIGIASSGAYAGEPSIVNPAVDRQPERKFAQELLIKFKPNQRPTHLPASKMRIAQLEVERLPLSPGRTAEETAALWRNRPDVVWVQPNTWRYALSTEVTPNDPYYHPSNNSRQYQQWYLPKINANYTWSVARGSQTMKVAVVDSGIDLQHPDLKDRLDPGISIVHQDDYTPPAFGQDDHGHGTHVAGIIGALTDNHVGIAGCSWNGRLLPVKVLNHKGEGTDADIAEGILWSVDAGARIINLSLGGPAEGTGPPPVLQAAVDYAYAHGCLVVAASGNSGDKTLHYPAGLNHVLTVGATDPWDRRADYSSYGSDIDVVAPGGAGENQLSKQTGILSTYWNENSQATDFISGSEAGEYAITSGTSMAAALVSGAALVLWNLHSNYSVDQLESAFKSSAQDLGTAGPDEETGAGRIDLLAALGTSPAEQPELTLYNYPNPFNPEQDGNTHIVFLLDAPQNGQIRIYDVSRDLVWERAFKSEESLSGKNVMSWDGRNSSGARVANGAYYVRVTLANGRASQTKVIAVLR